MPNLAVEKEWGGGSVPIKFSAWYDCARDPGGQATYALYVQIKPLSSSWWFGYPINVSAEIRVGNGAWQTLLWPNSTTSWMFKDKSPLNWSADIQYNTQNKLITASPGQNVQIKLRIYSNGASDVVDRDKTFTWSNLIVPQLNTSQITNVTSLSAARNATATISANVYNISQTHTLTVYCGGNKIAERTIASTDWSGSGTSRTYSFVLATSPVNEVSNLLNAVPNSTTGTVTYTLTTGNPAIGSSTRQGSCTIPDTTGNKPSVPTLPEYEFKHAYTPEGSSTDFYIQGETTLEITSVTSRPTFTTPNAGALLSYYVVRVTTDGNAVDYRKDSGPSASDPWVIPMPAAGNTTIQVLAYDTRGRSGSRTVTTVFVQPYHPPRIVDYVSMRCDSTGTEDPSGLYFKGVVNTDVSTFTQYHTVTLTNGGYVSITYVQYNSVQYYESGDVITGIPDGAVLTVHVGDPMMQGQTKVVVDGETVANNPGGPYYQALEYELEVTRDLSVEFDINVGSDCGIILVSTPPINKVEIKVDYKPTTSSQWTEGAWVVFPGATYSTGAIGAGNIAEEQSYDIRYTIRDAIYTDGINVIDYLSSAKFTLFLAKGGNAVSVGEVYSPAEGSDEKVLNVAEDWVINRGGEPAIRNVGGWTVHYLGDGYVEMWGEISETIDQWTQWSTSDIYYSQYKYHKTYPQISPSQNNVFAAPPVVSATLRTYYTSPTNQPSLWLIGDGHDSANTSDSQKNHTPYYTIGRVGGGITASATICFHVFGKLATS